MGRRKISENRKEEITYRLLQLIRNAKAYGTQEIRTRYLAIRDLATLWEVPLAVVIDPKDPERFFVSQPGARSVQNAEESKTPVAGSVSKEKDLTPKPTGGILDELGWGDKDGNQKA